MRGRPWGVRAREEAGTRRAADPSILETLQITGMTSHFHSCASSTEHTHTVIRSDTVNRARAGPGAPSLSSPLAILHTDMHDPNTPNTVFPRLPDGRSPLSFRSRQGRGNLSGQVHLFSYSSASSGRVVLLEAPFRQLAEVARRSEAELPTTFSSKRLSPPARAPAPPAGVSTLTTPAGAGTPF